MSKKTEQQFYKMHNQMAYKHLKEYLTSVFWEIQIKTTSRQHSTPSRVMKIWKTVNKKLLWNKEQWVVSSIANCKVIPSPGKYFSSFCESWPSYFIPKYVAKRNSCILACKHMYKNIHYSSIWNSSPKGDNRNTLSTSEWIYFFIPSIENYKAIKLTENNLGQ